MISKSAVYRYVCPCGASETEQTGFILPGRTPPYLGFNTKRFKRCAMSLHIVYSNPLIYTLLHLSAPQIGKRLLRENRKSIPKCFSGKSFKILNLILVI